MTKPYLVMTRLQAAQSIANEHGWGEVEKVRDMGDGWVEVQTRRAWHLLNGLLAYEILRRPEDNTRAPKPGSYAPGQNTHTPR